MRCLAVLSMNEVGVEVLCDVTQYLWPDLMKVYEQC